MKIVKVAIIFNIIVVILFFLANYQIWAALAMIKDQVAITNISALTITIKGPIYLQPMSPAATTAPINITIPNFSIWLFLISTIVNLYLIIKFANQTKK
jgi:hypothetical protein